MSLLDWLPLAESALESDPSSGWTPGGSLTAALLSAFIAFPMALLSPSETWVGSALGLACALGVVAVAWSLAAGALRNSVMALVALALGLVATATSIYALLVRGAA